jgi:hypothetical protein
MKYINHGLPYVCYNMARLSRRENSRVSYCLALLRKDDNEKKDRGAASANAKQSELPTSTTTKSKIVRLRVCRSSVGQSKKEQLDYSCDMHDILRQLQIYCI